MCSFLGEIVEKDTFIRNYGHWGEGAYWKNDGYEQLQAYDVTNASYIAFSVGPAENAYLTVYIYAVQV